ITDTWSWNIMFNPDNAANTVGNNVLQDVVATWAPGNGFEVKAGQFKMPTTYEATMVAAKDILFFDRNQVNRVIGDKRDRGIWASYKYGHAESFTGKVSLAVSNGSTDDGSGGKTAVDANAQKDFMGRFEGTFSKEHKFGFYYRDGVHAVKDINTVAGTFAGVTPPTAAEVRDNKDRTTLMGAYYAFTNESWYADAEYATGLLGRRFPSLFAAGAPAAGRQHLDQKFMGFAVTGVYKMGQHWLLARYDVMDYNAGDDWYTAYNPYTETAVGVSRNADYSPKFTELTLGYNYVFVPTKSSYGKLKFDYILRSKNFKQPIAPETGEKGGDSFVVSLQLGF
ncbi:MAG TPA: porin, partial [Geothrix sp.]|nr:porin [Geothrix sp.]